MDENNDDIINLPHYVSKRHPQMPVAKRAAQFLPFIPIEGYKEMIKEANRQTEERPEMDDELAKELNEKYAYMLQHLSMHPLVTITYFIPDTKKSGGSFRKVTGNLKSIDEYNKRIILTDRTVIPISDIFKIIV